MNEQITNNKKPIEELKEILDTINKKKETITNRAQKVNRLIECHSTWRKRELSLTPLKAPVLLFGRRSGIWEIYEGVSVGEFKYRHSNGEERYIIINPHTKDKLTDGKNYLPVYLGHEDHPITGWPEPITTAEQMNMFAEKILNDMKQWLAKLDQIKNEKWLYIGGSVALVILAVALFRTLAPPQAQQTIIYAGQEAINQTIENATKIVNQLTNITPKV